MVKEFRLELTQQEGQSAYTSPGEISGHVVVVTDVPKKYKAITVSLHGYANVEWPEKETKQVRRTRMTGGGRRGRHTESYMATETVTVVYREHESYINETIPLWNHEETPNTTLAPGTYAFPFRFHLSERCPSSFLGVYGHIKYTMEARISTGRFSFDKVITSDIQVVQRVVINEPALLSPVEYHTEKMVWGLWCASFPITLNVQLSRTGYCMGEGIEFTAAVNNRSGRTVRLRATLFQQQTYRAQGHTRTIARTVETNRSPAIHGRTTYQWTLSHRTSPRVPTISMANIVIGVGYRLLIEAVIPFASNDSVSVPITYGTVNPLTFPAEPPALPQSEHFFNASPSQPQVATYNTSIPVPLPPSYDECMSLPSVPLPQDMNSD